VELLTIDAAGTGGRAQPGRAEETRRVKEQHSKRSYLMLSPIINEPTIKCNYNFKSGQTRARFDVTCAIVAPGSIATK